MSILATAQRSKADDYLQVAIDIAGHRSDDLLPEQHRIINFSLLNARRIMAAPSERTAIVDQALDETREPEGEPLAQARIRALFGAYDQKKAIHPYETARGYLREIDDLLVRFPGLSHSREYISSLGHTLNPQWYWDAESFGRKARGLDRALADPMVSDGLRAFALRVVGPQLLFFYSTPAELEKRREYQRRYLVDVEFVLDIPSEIEHIRFLGCTGEIDEQIKRCRPALAWMIKFNVPHIARLVFNLQISAHAALGHDLDMLLEKLKTYDRCNDGRCEQWRIVDMVRTGLLCGRVDWTRSVIDMVPDDSIVDMEFEGYSRVCLASNDQELRLAVLDHPNRGFGWECIEMLGALLHGKPDADLASATDAAAAALTATTVRVDQLLLCRALLRLIDVLRDRMQDEYDWSLFDTLAHDTAIDELEWLVGRRIPAYMPPVLDLLERHGTAAELQLWRRRYEQILRERLLEMEPRPESLHLMVSMLDTITTRMAGDEPVRVRGPRVQALLGTLVADRMLATPLTQLEFWRIAAGGEKDPEKARNITNMTVHRLRELLGEDAIITPPAGAGQTGTAPRLNIELVDVDLLEADRMIAETRRAVRSGALMRAVPLLTHALEIGNGQVPFPGLYDEFFESARGDFESRLRDTTMDISRALLREEDAAGAEAILRRAFAAMPDDEEISELLRTTLLLLDRRTEAERVRLRVE